MHGRRGGRATCNHDGAALGRRGMPVWRRDTARRAECRRRGARVEQGSGGAARRSGSPLAGASWPGCELAHDDPTQYLMDFVHESNFKIPHVGQNPYPQLEAHNWFERDVLIRKQIERPSTHRPQVYTLPRNHDIVQQTMLTPCEDLQFLSDKFRRDICSATGVPYEMVSGKEGGGSESTRKTMDSGRIFSVNMHEFCRHCQNIIRGVYCHIYRVEPESVEFVLTPMPRLEVESVNDLKILFEIGALTPDMSVELSKILLENAARPFRNSENFRQFVKAIK
jgi:hypothetical protein